VSRALIFFSLLRRFRGVSCSSAWRCAGLIMEAKRKHGLLIIPHPRNGPGDYFTETR
jgi:hypothetical protein